MVRNDVTRVANGSLRFGEMNDARTPGTPGWLHAVQTSGRAEISVAFRPQSPLETAAIMMLASDFWHTDFAIGQDHADLLVWLRRPGSDGNGDPPFTLHGVIQPQRWNNVQVILQRTAIRIDVDGTPRLSQHLGPGRLRRRLEWRADRSGWRGPWRRPLMARRNWSRGRHHLARHRRLRPAGRPVDTRALFLRARPCSTVSAGWHGAMAHRLPGHAVIRARRVFPGAGPAITDAPGCCRPAGRGPCGPSGGREVPLLRPAHGGGHRRHAGGGRAARRIAGRTVWTASTATGGSPGPDRAVPVPVRAVASAQSREAGRHGPAQTSRRREAARESPARRHRRRSIRLQPDRAGDRCGRRHLPGR